jgi:hypothetical protein
MKNKTLGELHPHEIIDYLRFEQGVIIPLYIEKWVMEYWLEGTFNPEQITKIHEHIKTQFHEDFFNQVIQWAVEKNDEQPLIDPPLESSSEDLPF